jgi:flagellum-specific peptidoglycan hydrolase FlgJ
MIMRKSYWKESCLLLIGLILGCIYQKHFGSLPIKQETTIVKKDTIVKHDTIYAKTIVPKLSKKSVLAELKRQNVPHPNIVLAQSILETGNYSSKLTRTHNNIFGLKKGNKYKKYNNYSECISDYKKRISSRYKGGSYYEFLEKIKYAENPSYTSILKDMV